MLENRCFKQGLFGRDSIIIKKEPPHTGFEAKSGKGTFQQIQIALGVKIGAHRQKTSLTAKREGLGPFSFGIAPNWKGTGEFA